MVVTFMSGYKIGTKKIHILYYADSTVMTADSDELHRHLQININMSINSDKMMMSKEPVRSLRIVSDDCIVEQISEFKYTSVATLQ